MSSASKLCFCCAWAALSFAASATAQEGKLFQFKPPEGEKPIYQTTLKMDQTHTVEGQTFATTMRQTTISQWTFENLDAEGNLQFVDQTKRLKVSLKIDPVAEYQFDSTAGRTQSTSILGEALDPVYRRLATAAMTVTISPRGEVKSAVGQNELIEDVLKGNPVGAQLAGTGSKEAAKLDYADRFMVFSDKPVEPGDTWETEFDVTLVNLGQFAGKRTYTYVGPDQVGETATEKFTVTYELEGTVKLKEAGAELSGTLAAKDSSGTIQFDPVKGRIVSLECRYTVAGDISLKSQGTTRKIVSSQTQSIERLLLEKLPE